MAHVVPSTGASEGHWPCPPPTPPLPPVAAPPVPLLPPVPAPPVPPFPGVFGLTLPPHAGASAPARAANVRRKGARTARFFEEDDRCMTSSKATTVPEPSAPWVGGPRGIGV